MQVVIFDVPLGGKVLERKECVGRSRAVYVPVGLRTISSFDNVSVDAAGDRVSRSFIARARGDIVIERPLECETDIGALTLPSKSVACFCRSTHVFKSSKSKRSRRPIRTTGSC